MTEPLIARHSLEYPGGYTRSVGPIIGRFLTGLRDGRIEGVRLADGRVLVPPTEYDPQTAAPTTVEDFVEVGPLGTVEAVAAVTPASMRAFRDAHVSPRHAVLAIAGDFDVDPTVATLTKALADWKPKEEYARLTRSGDVKLSRKVETISTPDKANATYAAGMVFPLRDDSPDFAPLVMADFILGGGTLSSRLGDRVRQKEGLSYGVRSNVNVSSVDQRAAFSIMAICNPVNMEKVKVAIDEEVARLLKDGVTAEELELAKRGFLQQQEVARTDDLGLAKILADNLYAGRTMKYQSNLEKAVGATTVASVAEAFRKYVDPKRMVIIEAGDFSKRDAGAKPQKPAGGK